MHMRQNFIVLKFVTAFSKMMVEFLSDQG